MTRIIYICTGNTCRSPMAMAYTNYRASVDGLDITADSAGLYAENYVPYSKHSIDALAEAKISLSGSSKAATLSLLGGYDYIVGISQSHCNVLKQRFPELSDKIYAFPADISDPFGGTLEDYKGCLSEIRKGVDKILEYIKNERN